MRTWRHILSVNYLKNYNYKVTKDFLNRVQEKALGEDVLKAVSPGQQIVKIVHDEIAALIGPVDSTIEMKQDGPTVIIAHTIKGKGVSYMEGEAEWHYRVPSIDELKLAMEELNVNV